MAEPNPNLHPFPGRDQEVGGVRYVVRPKDWKRAAGQ